MRILIIPSWYSNPRNQNAGIFVKNQAKCLLDFGIDVEVIYFDLDFRNFFDLLGQGKSKIVIRDHSVVPCTTIKGIFAPKRNAFVSKKWSKYCCKIYSTLAIKRPDIIHAHSYFAGMVAMEIFEKYGIPYVVTENHSGFPNESIPNWQLPLIQEVFMCAKQVISVSIQLKQILDNRFNLHSTYLPNCVDPKVFNAKFQTKSGKRGIFVGGLIERKGITILVDVLISILLSKKAIFQFEIIGEGPLKAKLFKKVKNSGLDKYIHFCGLKSNNEVANLMQESDFFVLPSWAENNPVAMIEAQMCGLPAISSDLPWAKDIISEETGILIPAGSHEALKQAIIYLLFNLKKFDDQVIRERACKKFSNEVVCNQLNQIYKTVLNELQSGK